MQGSELPFYGPETPTGLKQGAPTTCQDKSGLWLWCFSHARLLITHMILEGPFMVSRGSLGYLVGRWPWADEAEPTEASGKTQGILPWSI